MLAALRDSFRPQDPNSSPLLCKAKDQFFSRLSVKIHPNKPGFKETRWIASEDVNVEHLIDIFTTIDAASGDVWETCASFIGYMRHWKPRIVVLESNIRRLPDDHPSKRK